jgi:amidohydrolase
MDRTKLDAALAEELPHIEAIRRDLHRHPELMFEERRTSETVQRELTAAGITFETGFAKGTGVLAHLPATEAGASETVALRADMDALPITEASTHDHVSENTGVMHACGHDGHTAILIGAARVLSRLEHRPQHVTMLFQPAEEGGAGGRFMVEEGALNGSRLGSRVDRIYGLHGWPNVPRGVVATKPGPLLAATDVFELTISGVGCHAAFPHLGHDPIVASAQVVTALQTLVSRETDPLDSAVVSVTTIHGGDAFNVIPSDVKLSGTVRTLSMETRERTKRRVQEIVQGVAAACGCSAEMAWEDGYPVTENHPDAVDRFEQVAREALGESNVGQVEKPVMGGEDFSFYCREAPACFFLLGLLEPGDDPASVPQLHQPRFDFNDRALEHGVRMMVELGLRG